MAEKGKLNNLQVITVKCMTNSITQQMGVIDCNHVNVLQFCLYSAKL